MQPAWGTRGRVINPEPSTALEFALKYAALGWAVLPLHWMEGERCSCGNPKCFQNAGKHPYAAFAPNGVHSATKDAAVLTQWFTKEPRLNVGIACGAVSGIVVVDVDPRNGGDDNLDAACAKFGKLPDTVEAISGGSGRHIVFQYPEGKRLKSPGKGIDVQGDGKYFVAAPSKHKSGRKYEWEGSSDPFEGVKCAPLPVWFTDGDKAGNAGGNLTLIVSPAVGFLSDKRIADLRGAMQHLDADDYHTWVQVGQALHSTDAAEAFELWDTWSQNSTKYNANETRRKWGSFGADRGIHVESVFAWATQAGWDGIGMPVASALIHVEQESLPETTKADCDAENERERVSVRPNPCAVDGPPSHLLALPGVLGEIVEAINATAPKLQPQFAVQTALAVGSVVLGRRYVTTKDNFTSSYFLAVGKSGCGKEYGRTVAERVLEDAGLGALIGGGGYTSAAAVQTALMNRPAHLSFMDEFGDLLAISAVTVNAHKATALTELKKAWSSCGSTLRPDERSGLGASAAQRREMLNTVIKRPALSLVGMTTPEKFFSALTSNEITGGFLNRVNVVETNLGREVERRMLPKFVTPKAFVEWCKLTRSDDIGNLATAELGHDTIPPERTINFEDAALDLFYTYAQEIVDTQNEHDGEGLADMFSRDREKAMRISAILAAACDPLKPLITAELAQWAVDYVRFYTSQTVISIRRNMHGTKHAAWVAEALRIIKRGGRKGATERELCTSSRELRGLDPKQMANLFISLRTQGEAGLVEVPSASGRGRPRKAWVSREHLADMPE